MIKKLSDYDGGMRMNNGVDGLDRMKGDAIGSNPFVRHDLTTI